MQFYSLDPWGEQRADMRAANLMWASLTPHTKSKINPNDYLLFPDSAHSLPDDVADKEREWMARLGRMGG